MLLLHLTKEPRMNGLGFGTESPPDSFDALAARLNQRFDKLAADIEQMRRELDEAEERSERLRHKLLDNGALRG